MQRVLITVKTYPTLSKKYAELVCTAGFREDGSWIRIYPIPFRKLEYDQQYQKYQWIEVDLTRNLKDFRPESYKLLPSSEIKIQGKIESDKNAWVERRDVCLKNVHYDIDNLIREAKDSSKLTSLATFKPLEIVDFFWEKDDPEWDRKKMNSLIAQSQQLELFGEVDSNVFSLVSKLPYKFKYRFKDEKGRICNLMIEDWEIGALYFKLIGKGESEESALKKVRYKYFDTFALKKDIYLFLGTTLSFHKRSKNPFMIIGVFYPNHLKPIPPLPATLF